MSNTFKSFLILYPLITICASIYRLIFHYHHECYMGNATNIANLIIATIIISYLIKNYVNRRNFIVGFLYIIWAGVILPMSFCSLYCNRLEIYFLVLSIAQGLLSICLGIFMLVFDFNPNDPEISDIEYRSYSLAQSVN